MNILEYTFFQNALLGSFLASILCGLIGTYIVTRRLVFISGGITHASFGGIGLGVVLGISPILSAMGFSILSAFGVQWMSHRGDVREDSAIAVFWTFGMSLGIICCFLSPGFMPDLPSFLFGSILTIGEADLWLLGTLVVLVTVVFVLLYRTILSVATLRMVGIMLSISLLTIPQMTANTLTHDLKRIIAWSIVIGWIDCLLGLSLSYSLNVPSGASIIFVSILVYLVAKVGRVLHNQSKRKIETK